MNKNSTNSFEAIACGSYRRGKEVTGDIDIILTRKDSLNYGQFL